MNPSSIFKNIIRILVTTLLGVYIGLIVLLNIPYIQKNLSSYISTVLSEKLNTEVKIGKVDIGLLNRIILEDANIKDRDNNNLLHISHLAAKFDILPLFENRINISSVQLFNFRINANKKTPDSQTNFQFIIDALSSKEKKEKSKLDLRINSILVRNGNLSYDILSKPYTDDKFNINHISVNNLSAIVSLKALTNDSINARVRRLSFIEGSGFKLNKLSFRLTANNKQLNLNNVDIELPNSYFSTDSLKISYNKLSNILKFSDDIRYSAFIKAHTSPSDFSAFVPSIHNYRDILDFGFEIKGNNKNIICNSFHFTDHHGITIQGLAKAHNFLSKDNGNIEFTLQNFNVTNAAINNVAKNFNISLPDVLTTRDFINFKGTMLSKEKKAQINGLLSCDAGNIKSNILLDIDENGIRTYSGKLSCGKLMVDKLLNDNRYGDSDFNIEIKGFSYKNKYPESYVKGAINSFVFQGYKYENISLDGNYKDGGFDGKLGLKDENIALSLNGNFNTTTKTPSFNLKAKIDNFNPNRLHLTDSYKDTKFAFNVNANFTGNSIDNLNGNLSVDSLYMRNDINDEVNYYLPSFKIGTTYEQKKKEIIIESPFINGEITGNFSYSTLPASFIHTVQRYIPSLLNIKEKYKESHNNFKFDINVNDGEFFSKILNIPVILEKPASFKGYFNDSEKDINIEAHLPMFKYNGVSYDSGVLLCNNTDKSFNCDIRAGILMGSGAMVNLSLNTQAENNNLKTKFNWGNNTDITYGGTLSAVTHFNKINESQKSLNANVRIEPSVVILNDSIWNIHASNININGGNIYVNNFLFEHDNQHLRIDGALTKNENDSCIIDLKNVNLEYLLDIVQFDDVEFAGMITGNVILKNLLRSPDMYTKLNVKDFALNGAILGDANINGSLNKDKSAILLDARIKDKDSYTTHVSGFVSPKYKGLDLHIDAGGTNIALITPFVDGILSNINGRANGHVRLYGDFKHLDLEGELRTNLEARIDVLNTYYRVVNDSVHIKSGEIAFNNMRLQDIEGNNATLTGYLHHNKLKNLMYHLNIDGENLLMYNTTKNNDLPFYGKVYATGNVTLDGGNNAMNVNAKIKTAPNTVFAYVTSLPDNATNNQFITFIDKTPKRIDEVVKSDIYHFSDIQEDKDDEGPAMDLHINLSIETTPDANMKIIMDPVAGDNITATGRGNLQVNYYNKGDFRILGNYTIDKGLYKLSMQDIIRKDFTLNQGGTVSFSGDPYQGNLDVQAVYTVNSASLADLGMDTKTIQGRQSSVKVNCLMNVTGKLSSPDIKFDIDLPTLNEEDKAFVRSATSTEEQMNTQIIYLLGVGKFYTVDYANNNQQTSSNATSSLAFSTLSGQLNNMLSQWMENKNWNIGANLTTGEKGWTDVEAEAMLSGSLLNNRLLINGNFGYKDNTMSNNNFIGDFEAIWLLTKDGDWRLRGYNQTNDKYYIKSTLTTQGIGLMYKKDFNKWKDLFNWALWWKHYKKEENE